MENARLGRIIEDWEQSSARVVLALSSGTRLVGLGLLAIGLYLVILAWPVSQWLALAPAGLASLGGLLLTLRRELVVDREAGVLRVDQRAFGFGNQTTVPLFHLRAVVVMARQPDEVRLRPQPSKYVAYLDRRVGDAIYLDEARRCASLLKLAEVIAEVAELRLEYDASQPS